VTEPDLMHGAWGRRSVSIDGGPHFETQDVVWLQAGTCYADLRIPFHAAASARCLTGRSGWDGDQYRWRRRLDSDTELDERSPAAEKVGDLNWEDGLVVERGRLPTRDGWVAYEEVWARLPGGDGRFLALEAPDACLVRVGDHAVTVVDTRSDGGSFAACYRLLVRGRWNVIAMLGDAEALPGPAERPGDWRVVHKGAAEVARV
jgi:hypothetical protein